ncbi:J domain-containing protein [Gammaproteobacteria bacterium]|nr:J domain-containing protein [Gammaproteobacteria bacterium]
MMENNEKSFAISNTNTPETKYRLCDWPNCRLEGIHRAPISQDRIREYSWFCLEHVRIYNSSWNYYEGMSIQEFNELVRLDTMWNRPTWPLGDPLVDVLSKNEDITTSSESTRKNNNNFNDPFGFFTKDNNFRRPNEQEAENSLSIEEKKALMLLGVDIPVKISELKARYKLLVKECHPDKTGGNKKLEERFKQINEAYQKVMTKLTKN